MGTEIGRVYWCHMGKQKKYSFIEQKVWKINIQVG